MNTDLITYYQERAKEYEKIYEKPERQEDLATATKVLQDIFADKEVLEVACGTGYWTERIAKTARLVYARDINQSVIDIAQQKGIPNASFAIEDIYTFKSSIKYESLFGGFIWSHIKLEDLDELLNRIHSLILKGGTIVWMDNRYIEGSNHPIIDIDSQGNQYQTRQLENGTSHLVLKNFPSEAFLRECLKGIGEDIEIINLRYYWILIYRV